MSQGNNGGYRKGLGVAFTLGTELMVATLLGMLMGWGVDHMLGTFPWFLAIGLLLGGAAGCLNVYRAVQEMNGGGAGEDRNKDNKE